MPVAVRDAYEIAYEIAQKNPFAGNLPYFEIIENYRLGAPGATDISSNVIYYNPKLVEPIVIDVKSNIKGAPKETVEFLVYSFLFLHEIYHHVFNAREWFEEAKRIRSDLPEQVISMLLNIFHDALINEFVLGDLFQYFSMETNPILVASLIMIFKKSAIDRNLFIFRESLEPALTNLLTATKCSLPKEYFDRLKELTSGMGADFLIGMKEAFLEAVRLIECPQIPEIPREKWNDLKPPKGKHKGHGGGKGRGGGQVGGESKEKPQSEGEGGQGGGSGGEEQPPEGEGGGGKGKEGGEKEKEKGGSQGGGKGEEKGGKEGSQKGREGEEQGGESQGEGEGEQGKKGGKEGKSTSHGQRTRGIGHAEFREILKRYLKKLEKAQLSDDEIVKAVSEAISLSNKSSSAFKKLIVETTIDFYDIISSFFKKESDYSASVYGPVDIAVAKYQIEKYGRVLSKTYELETRKSEPFVIWVIDTSGSIGDAELEAMANVISAVGQKLKKQYIVAFSDIAVYAKVEGGKSQEEILRTITELAMKSGRGGTVVESAFKAVKEILSSESTSRYSMFVLAILSDYLFGKVNEDELDISDYTREFRKSVALLLNVGDEEALKEFMYKIYYEFTDVEAYDVIILDNRVRVVPLLLEGTE